MLKHLDLWIIALFVAISFAGWLIAWTVRRFEKQAREEKFQQYFKRLDDADKPNQRGI